MAGDFNLMRGEKFKTVERAARALGVTSETLVKIEGGQLDGISFEEMASLMRKMETSAS